MSAQLALNVEPRRDGDVYFTVTYGPISQVSHEYLEGADAHNAAVARALDLAGPNLDHLSVALTIVGSPVWAIRHIKWDAGNVSDSGWRGWDGATFLGAVDTADLMEISGARP